MIVSIHKQNRFCLCLLTSAHSVRVHLSSEIIKNKFQRIRKLRAYVVGVKLHTPRDRWMFAINCILLLLKKHKHELNSITLRSSLVRLGFRREYMKLYKRVLLYKLGQSGIPENAKAFYINGLSVEEDTRLNALHDFFPLNDLLLFRLSVHYELQKKGIYSDFTKSSAQKNSNHSYWSSATHKNNDNKNEPDKKKVFLSLNSNSSELDSSSNLSIEFNFFAPRVSVTIFDVSNDSTMEKQDQNHFKNAPMDANSSSPSTKLDADCSLPAVNIKQKVSFAVYGIYCGAEIASEDDLLVSFSAGSVKLYGVHGEEVISCGSNPNKWVDSCKYETESYKGNHDLAFFVSYQSCITSNADACNFSFNNINDEVDNFKSPQKFSKKDPESKSKAKISDRMFFALLEASKIERKHKIVELMLGLVTFHWSSGTLQSMISLYTNLIPPTPTINIKPLAYYRHLAATLSIQRFIRTEPSKLSLDISVQGFVLSIMYGKSGANNKFNDDKNTSRMRSSTAYYNIQEFNPFTREYNDDSVEINQKFLQFTINRLSLRAGDYLQEFAPTNIKFGLEDDTSVESKTKKPRMAPSPDVLRKLYTQQNLQNFEPMIIHVSDVQISFVESRKSDTDSEPTITKKYLTKVPWSVYGAVSFNKHGNELSPAYIKADLFCSALKLTLSTEVIYLTYIFQFICIVYYSRN